MKKSFIMYVDMLDVIDGLQDGDIAELFRAIKNYHNGIEPELGYVSGAIFPLFKNQFERDETLYNEKCQRLRDNASRGGKASASKRKQMVANGSKSKQTERDNVTDNDNDNEKQKKATRFAPPSLQELKAYIKEKDLNVGAETFINHYEANGWMVGRTKMKDWRAAARNWSKRNNDQNKDDRESSEKKWQDSATGIRDKGKEVGLRETDFDSFPIFKGAVEREVRRLDNAR